MQNYEIRFDNVYVNREYMITLFKNQNEEGEPFTDKNTEMTNYIITNPES
ncbi:polysaccharide biosynthesis protein [Staphylococcus aureus]|nr:polysaccharide biosynthesis protein [Staphylococcus aureus]